MKKRINKSIESKKSDLFDVKSYNTSDYSFHSIDPIRLSLPGFS